MYVKTKSKKEKKRGDIQYFKKLRAMRKIYKLSWYEKIDSYLKKGDYPYDMTPELYIILHATILVGITIFLLRGNFSGMRIIMLAPVFLNVLIFQKIKERNNRMQMELCNIQDIIYFQSKIDTPQEVILSYAAKAAQEPLKTPLRIFSDKLKLNKDLNKALEELRKVSNLMEFQAFTFIIEQRQKTGYSEQNHHAQATMLKRSKRMKRNIEREGKRVKLTVAAFLMFGCYMAFASVPLVKGAWNSINIMFR